ncbi:MAG: hypothetical protein ACXWQQ_09890, partial [Pseudobdellovibrio sp.]
MKNLHNEIPFYYRFMGGFNFVFKHIFPQSEVLEKMRRSNVNGIVKSLEQNKSRSISLTVERRENLSEQEFIKNYLNKGLPVIFSQEANNWACTKKWNFEFLKEQYPDDEFSLIDTTGLVEKKFDKSQGKDRPVLIDKIKASEFVEAMKRGEKIYLRFCPIMEIHPELADDLDQTWLKKMRRCFLGISYQTFIGPTKRKTP